MPLDAQSLLMQRRNGPAIGPTPTAPGAPGGGSPDSGSLISSALSELLNQQRTADKGYTVKVLTQLKRVTGALFVHMDQQMPAVARHLNRAWSAFDAALKEAENQQKAQAVPAGPSLGFSGANLGGTPQGASPLGGMR